MMLLLCTWIFKPTILNRIEWNLSEEINNTTKSSIPLMSIHSYQPLNLSLALAQCQVTFLLFCLCFATCSLCFVKKYHFKDLFLFFSQNFHKNLFDIPWYTAVKNWPFSPGESNENQVVFQLPTICLQARKRICCNEHPTTLSKWSFLEGNLSWIPKIWFILRRMFLLQEDIRSLYLLGFSLFVFFGDGSERLVDSIYYPSWN